MGSRGLITFGAEFGRGFFFSSLGDEILTFCGFPAAFFCTAYSFLPLAKLALSIFYCIFSSNISAVLELYGTILFGFEIIIRSLSGASATGGGTPYSFGYGVDVLAKAVTLAGALWYSRSFFYLSFSFSSSDCSISMIWSFGTAPAIAGNMNAGTSG